MKIEGQDKEIASKLCNIVMDNPNFKIWSGSGSNNKHHYGQGGLYKHTIEVTHLMYDVNFRLKLNLDNYLITLVATYHDIGKLHDYEPVDKYYLEWRKTEHCRKVHHISRSSIIWNLEATKLNFPQIYIDEVTHAILSHHGQREWGSPVTPKTKLAWLLHLCDNLSARMNDCDKIDLIKVK